MQKLVWQNANGETIDLTSGSYGITEWEGFSNASLNIQSQQVPFQDGAVFLDALIEPRELSVTLKMQDNNNLELRYQLRRELIHKLNPKLGEGYLIYTNDFISKRIKCVAQIPLFETHNSNDSGTPKASLSWVANEPYWEDLQETVVSISGLNTIQNEGDVSAQVEIIIPTGASNPSIANRRNDKQIKLVGDYDSPIEINTNLGRKYIQSNVLEFMWKNGGSFNGVAYGDKKYVYVGSEIVIEDYMTGKIYSIKEGNESVLYDVVFANNQFIAVGASGTILTSSDGITWISRTSGVNVSLNKIKYVNNQFIAVGASGTILTSTDGIDWTSRISGVNKNLYSVTYGNGLFVVVGGDVASGALILTSSDGINWTSQTLEINRALIDVAFGKDMFIALEQYTSNFLTSSDGINWTNQSGVGTSVMICIEFLNNNFIAGGSDGKVLIFRGLVPRPIITNSTNPVTDIIFANNLYTVLNNQIIQRSNDLNNWNIVINYTFTNGIVDMIFKNNLYVAVGYNTVTFSGGYIYISEDGINWTKVSQTFSALYSVTYGNGLFVAVGYNGTIYTSTNGTTWTSRTSGVNVLLYSVTYGNGLFVAVGASGTILTSANGTTWTSRTSGVTSNINNITYSDELNMFVAVGASGIILSSTNGITWTSRTSGVSFNIISIIYGNGLFVAIGNNGYIIKSFDGINWTNQNLGDMTFISINFADKKFIIVGNKGLILISYDSETWITQSDTKSYNFVCSSYGNNEFTIVGNIGVIYKSTVMETLNLISDLTSDSDMTFNLEIGNNDILYSDNNGNGATLKYRQKYIGV